ncbi:glycosyltransferase family 2 protein [Leuconostoc mesenteroides]|uniref:Glycosyltransferase, group 2 family protein n=1 Tax=Leuconostoc mesenteroides subsp. cremoris ATCC 19254 TaxID=586220 RepID=C2KHF0_LEUMC|nr:glycosyltransferase family 2 protein [Leuconostoc mesenteroides]EEJ43358.1 glycosyltransferase, group 2 family protein [Leuconostoc mesenteroides subsp. cremoris ATCC 19254]MDG9751019.1 glycosyltransferase family 2 protein [Leuconostoc mesenteroides]GEP16437.1 glycosyl transferase [Leuconostoc mesenteroides subsp. cremoris]
MNFELVSVIMPNYNTGRYVVDAVNSVLNQTYTNLELIIVDDNSMDDSVNILKDIASNDARVKLILLSKNNGAANARNVAIEKASGRYISFIDSDDIWITDKIDKQLKFMKDRNAAFVASYYDYIDFKNKSLNHIVKGPLLRDYFGVLKYCPGNSTVIYDALKLGKTIIPLIKRRNDYVMWLKVIKKSKQLYIMPDILVHYRIRPGSLSSNKKGLVKYHWYIYRKYEKLNIIITLYLIIYLSTRGIYRKIRG